MMERNNIVFTQGNGKQIVKVHMFGLRGQDACFVALSEDIDINSDSFKWLRWEIINILKNIFDDNVDFIFEK